MRRPDRHDGFCALAWLLCTFLYFWVAGGTPDAATPGPGKIYLQRNHYQLLVDGFLSGHLSLAQDPAPALLALPDPYDPAKNFPYRLHDASLYRGKYYLYFGPTPALLVLLPWKMLTGHHLPQGMAVAGFASAGLAALALLLSRIQRRAFPTATPGGLFFAVLVAGQICWLPVVLERPEFWELPIVTALALFWWALLFLWQYHASGGRPRWALAAGITLALLLGARPSYAPAVAVMTLLFALPWERERPVATALRRLWPVAMPLVVGGVALLLYNYERFDRFLEFGQHLQLCGGEYRNIPLLSPVHIPVNLRLYFFTTPDFSPYFPFVFPAWIGELPAGYFATEEAPNVFFALPIVFLAVAVALQWAWQGRHNLVLRPFHLVLAACIAAGLLGTGVILCFEGSTSRYVAEMMAGWTLPAAVGLLALFSSVPRLLPRLLAGAVTLWSVACVWLLSFEILGIARVNHPVTYHRVAEILNYPGNWIARASGQKFGPVELDVHLSETSPVGWTVLLAAGRPDMMNRLILERPAPGKVRLRMSVNDLQVIKTPVIDVTGTTLRVDCAAPWLYPPLAHPYWNTYPDNDDRLQRQYVSTITVNGQRYSAQSQWIVDSMAFAPAVRDAATRPAACAWVEQLRHLEAGP